MQEFYVSYLPLIFAIHLFSGVVWIGGMLFFTLNVYPSVAQIPNEKMFIRTSLRTLQRFFKLLVPISLLLALSGYFLDIGKDFAHRDPVMAVIVTSKKFIWLFMTVLFGVAFYKIKSAKRFCMASDSQQAKENVKLIAFYLFPLSILLGFAAIYFGFMLRGV